MQDDGMKPCPSANEVLPTLETLDRMVEEQLAELLRVIHTAIGGEPRPTGSALYLEKVVLRGQIADGIGRWLLNKRQLTAVGFGDSVGTLEDFMAQQMTIATIQYRAFLRASNLGEPGSVN